MRKKLAIAALTLSLSTPALAEESKVLLCLTSHIIDGDTVECVGGTLIRLWGIDTPELGTEEGESAKIALAALASNTILACVPKGESYGRIVAQCFVDIGMRLTTLGVARDCPRYSEGFYAPFEKRSDLPRRPSCERR